MVASSGSSLYALRCDRLNRFQARSSAWPSRRLLSIFPTRSSKELRRLAAKRNVSVTQALRQAIADSSFIEQQVEERNKLLIERRDGSVREVAVHR